MVRARKMDGRFNGDAGRFLIGALAAATALGLLVLPAEASEKGKLHPLAGEASKIAEDASYSDDPLQMVVSLANQRVDVYRGTTLIESSRISSGKSGYSTPTGIFSILEKRRRHYSNLYDDAPMPYMQRLTWSGVALHQGYVPNYPASHGCVRMPHDFARRLFGMTERGTHVLVMREGAVPQEIVHGSLLQPFVAEATVASLDADTIESDPALRGAIESDAVEPPALPEKTVQYSDKPLRILITRTSERARIRDMQRILYQLGYAPGPVDGVLGRKTRAAIMTFQEGEDLPVTGVASDLVLKRLYSAAGEEGPANGRVYVRQKFREIYSAPVHLKAPDEAIGTHIFTALGFAGGAREVRWMGMSADERSSISPIEALDRVEWPEKVRAHIEERLTPGSSLIVTDRGFQRHSGLGTDFIVTTR
ncbi:L,D-transpeptidase family protein [Stappia sp. GBMRC 2046]|uniref:L,D-transpeptidase family protein n=1 Tax=Stappia sediminis TaxID=2692190 RepID=A0A7X3S8R5_9HYPH|nr:L,D-transpeptidase family protein [Stappia sediminis]MXN66045.1 L,D-transpeptidase family protein [Stappia sediminis]